MVCQNWEHRLRSGATTSASPPAKAKQWCVKSMNQAKPTDKALFGTDDMELEY